MLTTYIPHFAKDNIQFGKKIAKEIGLDTRNYAITFVVATYSRAAEDSKHLDIHDFKWKDHILNFGRQIAKEYGIDTKEFANIVIRTAIDESYKNFSKASDKASKDHKLNTLILAQRQLKFAKEFARQHGLKGYSFTKR